MSLCTRLADSLHRSILRSYGAIASVRTAALVHAGSTSPVVARMRTANISLLACDLARSWRKQTIRFPSARRLVASSPLPPPPPSLLAPRPVPYADSPGGRTPTPRSVRLPLPTGFSAGVSLEEMLPRLGPVRAPLVFGCGLATGGSDSDPSSAGGTPRRVSWSCPPLSHPARPSRSAALCPPPDVWLQPTSFFFFFFFTF